MFVAAASLGRRAKAKAKANTIFGDPSVTFRLRCLHSSSSPSQFSPLLKESLGE